ncbi:MULTISPECIES: pyrimidine dimer DNA glycosylase/endonuclease V [unclassified Salinibacterium]|uniref:pyrimidine dimer DNA glycosylase/endonuclease V n=1 Tax=unclassified Salinibacterium TaxID=2632331 RepID=UPI00141E23E3|nr:MULTISPECIES: pyrimidine dimer DNA glycosylase/endonuclease V [unclassified Salinibacterium]
MRLWSVHPRYFDRQALTACWREGLLAQAVLHAPGRGYSRHPQLERFRATPDPMAAIGCYLAAIVDEADARGYRFAREKILCPPTSAIAVPVPTGQLQYEWAHLLRKLEQRSPDVARLWSAVDQPDPHPLFTPVEGGIASWERLPG